MEDRVNVNGMIIVCFLEDGYIYRERDWVGLMIKREIVRWINGGLQITQQTETSLEITFLVYIYVDVVPEICFDK